jgi:hypothetical protein
VPGVEEDCGIDDGLAGRRELCLGAREEGGAGELWEAVDVLDDGAEQEVGVGYRSGVDLAGASGRCVEARLRAGALELLGLPENGCVS